MKKWLRYTLIVLFTLIALAAVGFAGFRVGVMQGASFAGNMPFIGHMRGFDDNAKGQGNNNANRQQGKDNPHNFGNNGNGLGQGFGNPHNFGNQREFGNQRGFNQRGGFGRGGFFSPIFGLIKLVVLGALLWLGYKIVKNSGWKLVKTTSAPETSVEAEPVEVKAKRQKKE